MLNLAVTGFVSQQAGSVASANALLLQALLERDFRITFFSKASFVDPRPCAGPHPAFRFIDTDNRITDRLRARLQGIPGIGRLASLADTAAYNRLLIRRIAAAHKRDSFDLCLWLGDFARGSVPGIPTISFVQGPPGTDARSVINCFSEISALAGPAAAWKWRLLAAYRLSPWGLPPFRHTNLFIAGSTQSRHTFQRVYGIPESQVRLLPYPIDLSLFQPSAASPSRNAGLRCLWLGRIVPRKRLDLFLDGTAEAIRRGLDLHATIVGGIGFVPGYEKLISAFPYPSRLQWVPSMPREEVPELMRSHDVLVQPSEEENFGSSVAEAQACGLPVIVGATNGNADYLCSRDIRLADYDVTTLAAALATMASRKDQSQWSDPVKSRKCAEEHFSLGNVADQFEEILYSVAGVRK